jgi:hypothetical protein
MNQSERIEALVHRAEQLDVGTENCLNPQHPGGPEFWEQGAAAFRQDVRLEDCPLDPGAEQDDWLRGWMATELIEFGKFDDEPGSDFGNQKKN